MQYTVIEATPNFVYGRLSLDDTHDIARSCRKRLKKTNEDAGVGGSDGGVDHETRRSTISWLKSKRIRAALDEFVDEINDCYLNECIDDLTDEYQVTLYNNLDDHYDWHQDRYEEEELEEDGFSRELSISVCLSPSEFYEGAEFLIEDGSETHIRCFKMKYGDFCIFPSLTQHKINPLRAGERLSLVAWYGYYDE